MSKPTVELYVMFPIDLPKHLTEYLQEEHEGETLPLIKNFQAKDHPKTLPFLGRNGWLQHPMMLRVYPEKVPEQEKNISLDKTEKV